MTKKPNLELPEVVIELDLAHRDVIERVHANRSEKEEMRFRKNRSTESKEIAEAEKVLELALLGKTEKSVLEKYLIRLLQFLWVLTAVTDYLGWSQGGVEGFFKAVSFLGIIMRPCLVLTLFTVVMQLLTSRLSITSTFRELIHAAYFAKPTGKLLDEVERRMNVLHFMNQALALLLCMATVGFLFLVLGWEPAITYMGTPKYAVVYFACMGFVIWMGMFKVFAMKVE